MEAQTVQIPTLIVQVSYAADAVDPRWVQRVTAIAQVGFLAWTGAWTDALGDSRVMCALIARHA